MQESDGLGWLHPRSSPNWNTLFGSVEVEAFKCVKRFCIICVSRVFDALKLY